MRHNNILEHPMTQSLIALTDRFGRWISDHSLHDKPLAGYINAVLLMGVALGIRLLIAPVDAGLQYVTFFPAVTLAALVGGWRAGLVATALGVIFATWIFTPPYWGFHFDFELHEVLPNLIFLFDGAIVSFSLDAMNRYRRQFQQELTTAQQTERITAQLNEDLQSALRQHQQDAIQLQKSQAIIDSSDDAIISKTLTGVIESWNLGAERIFGYGAQEIIGQPMQKLFPPRPSA